MEDVKHACLADNDRQKANKNIDKIGKTVVLSEEKMRRKYLDGGGKIWRHDGGEVRVDCCPCCGLKKLFDKEPDFDKNKAHNDREDSRFIREQEHIRDYKAGKRSDPLVDSNAGRR